MVQRPNDAAVKDNYVGVKDAQIKRRKKECAYGAAWDKALKQSSSDG
jgi:hypothetical protein